VIVIPPAGEPDVRLVQADLELMDAAQIAGRLRRRVREFPQAEAIEGAEIQSLFSRLLDGGASR